MHTHIRRIAAWVMLLAFCGMTFTKAFHHHEWKAVEDVVCPMDGIAMSHHTLAHTILQAFDDDSDSHCAICHFTVTKVVLPTLQHLSGSATPLFIHPTTTTPCIPCNIKGVSLLRAPPFIQ